MDLNTIRGRRTKDAIEDLTDELTALVREHTPCTVRQAFYLAVTAGLISKEKTQYQVVSRLLTAARRAGRLAWNTIVDHTRSVHRRYGVDSLTETLLDTVSFHQRKMWTDAAVSVQLWCEKQTLVGSLMPIVEKYDVPLYATRGYPSATYVYEAAEEIRADGRPTTIFYIGDHDPSGKKIPENLLAQLNDLAPGSDITLEILAVLPWQIERWHLATRPTNRNDPNAKGFKGESTEVEAIEPDRLRQLCEDAITPFIDPHEWFVLKAIEKSEKEALEILPRGRFHEMRIEDDELRVPLSN